MRPSAAAAALLLMIPATVLAVMKTSPRNRAGTHVGAGAAAAAAEAAALLGPAAVTAAVSETAARAVAVAAELPVLLLLSMAFNSPLLPAVSSLLQ